MYCTGFAQGGGGGITIMELKLAQDLAIVGQDSLLLVFLDLRKVHDSLYQGRLLQTLDLFQTKTDLFSTRALILVHFKTVHYFYQPIFSLFSYLKMHNTI